MSGQLPRRAFLATLGAWAAVPALGAAPAGSLRPRLRPSGTALQRADAPEVLAAASGVSGQVAWAVADAKSGRKLESHNGALGLPPASVAKALTALYALETLGPEFRFTTRLLITGTLSNGIVSGDLVLEGGGDPLLDTNTLAALAQKLKAAGVREVRGRFLVYEGALPFVQTIDPGQPDHVGYSPAVSGIALNFNRVHFEWKKATGGYGVTMDARSDRYRPDVAMAEMAVVNRALPVYTYRDTGKDSWTVASGALGGGGARWLPVRRPGAYVADVFATLARANGIVLDDVAVVQALPQGARPVADHRSAPLREILRLMLKYSNNLTAEMVGMTASEAYGGERPQSLRASAELMSQWAARRFGMTHTALVDHSGLGGASRMSADDLVAALVTVRERGILRPILKEIAVRDAGGRVAGASPIKVNAKTGTLNFVSGLAGFMTAADGTEMAFAIFCADVPARDRIPRDEREGPPGARSWNGRAKTFQQVLIRRWGTLYGS